MPNQRSENQTLIAFSLDAELARGLDAARFGKSRSQFVREAIYEKLREMGVKLPASIITAPDRVGKGGRPTHKTSVRVKGNANTVNTTTFSTAPAADALAARGHILNEKPGAGGLSFKQSPVRYRKQKRKAKP